MPRPMATAPTLTVVLPVYNEEALLPELHQRLVATLSTLGLPYEVLYVDDGSSDRSLEVVTAMARADPRAGVLALSRNFGHQMALTAGLAHARGEQVQHPADGAARALRPVLVQQPAHRSGGPGRRPGVRGGAPGPGQRSERRPRRALLPRRRAARGGLGPGPVRGHRVRRGPPPAALPRPLGGQRGAAPAGRIVVIGRAGRRV